MKIPDAIEKWKNADKRRSIREVGDGIVLCDRGLPIICYGGSGYEAEYTLEERDVQSVEALYEALRQTIRQLKSDYESGLKVIDTIEDNY